MNKLKKIILYILIILFTAFLIIFSKNTLFNNIDNTNNNFTSITNDNNIELVEAVVTKVVDGDTIWVDIENNSYKVRFIGIDCPEYTSKIEPYGKEATDFTTKYLENKTVYLQSDITDTDSYDRLLRYIWLKEVDSISKENVETYLFNAILVKEGLAQSNYYKPNISLQSYLEELETEAKEQKKGMWQ